MNDVVINVSNLSKLYHIGHVQQRHDTLRDALLQNLPQFSRPAAGRQQMASQQDNNSDLWALKDVSFEVKQGEVIGIIGRNGAGKSTLLKILSRITEPTLGRVELRGRVASLLEVGTGFHPELTGRENIYLNGAILGMQKREISRNFDAIVAFAELERFLDTPVKRYSSGMYVRLAFAVAAHLEPEILLVDEVLAVGDMAFQKKALGKMNDVVHQGRTVLFVSHNWAAVTELCKRVILLEKGSVSLDDDSDSVFQQYLLPESVHGVSALGNRTDRLGNGPLRFKSFYCVNHMSEISTTLRAGREAEMRVAYESSLQEPITGIKEITIDVFNALGQQITKLSTGYFDGGGLERLPPSGELTCRFDKLPLRSGRYIVNLFCELGRGVSDGIQQAGMFDVVDGDYYGSGITMTYNVGSVFLDHTWFSSPSANAEVPYIKAGLLR